MQHDSAEFAAFVLQRLRWGQAVGQWEARILVDTRVQIRDRHTTLAPISIPLSPGEPTMNAGVQTWHSQAAIHALKHSLRQARPGAGAAPAKASCASSGAGKATARFLAGRVDAGHRCCRRLQDLPSHRGGTELCEVTRQMRKECRRGQGIVVLNQSAYGSSRGTLQEPIPELFLAELDSSCGRFSPVRHAEALRFRRPPEGGQRCTGCATCPWVCVPLVCNG